MNFYCTIFEYILNVHRPIYGHSNMAGHSQVCYYELIDTMAVCTPPDLIKFSINCSLVAEQK